MSGEEASKKKRILAVHEKNLDSLLESLDLLEAIESGELRCAVCDTAITRENFRCVYPENGEIKVCCSRLECYKAVLRKLEEQS